jgi:hypothetical protein
MDQTFRQKPYASGRLRALLTILLLAVAIAHATFAMIWNAALGVMFRGTGDLGALEQTSESVTEMLYVWVALLQVVIFIATAVAFLLWLHRVYRNLPALGAAKPGTTPGWAVGYFFVPFVNLFKPFQVVSEIWRESTPAPETHEGFGGGSVQSHTAALVGWWWAFWLIASISMLAGERALDKSVTIEGMLLASRLIIAAHALFVVAGALAILVVKRIDEMQEAKFRQTVSQRPPPPPEHFETPRAF